MGRVHLCRSKIAWQKDGKNLHHSKKFHISNKGVLKLMEATLQDSGRYTCIGTYTTSEVVVLP